MSRPDSDALDASQRAAVQVPANIRQIVLAGPGSGKTEVVAALLRHLTEEEGLSATDELLVISFSRAAVAAVQRRTASEQAPPVTVRTLDALAGRLLDELDDSDAWRSLSFDRRIERATALLRDTESDELEMIEHLVVDEVQDVVGLRAEFLLEIISALGEGAGFTLLGDPMQAVYDFQLTARNDMTSSQLLERVHTQGRVVERRLTGQYRARTPEVTRILGMGAELLTLAGADIRADSVAQVLSRLLTAGALEDAARPMQRWPGTTAVLCRTNGEALVATAVLRAAGLPVFLQRAAQDPAASPLLARLLGDAPSDRVRRDDVRQRARALQVEEPDRLVLLLSDLAHSRGADIDIPTVARRVAARVVPIDLQQSSAARVAVSTVHRAKGLEYDNVVLVGATRWLLEAADDKDTDLDQAVRAAFVALSRARERITTCDALDSRRIWPDKRTGRWFRGGPKSWQTFGWEIRGSDTRLPHPPGDPADDVQEHLAHHVSAGDAVDLVLDPRRSTLELPSYAVHHGDLMIGHTNEGFATDLVRRIGPASRRQKPWPAVSGAVVESVETVGGPPQPVDLYGGSGRHGLWLSVRLTGMLDLQW